LCKDWPRGPMDADLHQPLASQVPALVLSGTADPVTPEVFGNEAALGFTHALHLKLKDQGHGQLAQPCVDKLMAQFLAAALPGKVPKLDASCVGNLRPPAFFLSLSGAGP
jgi:pimeloyl-ACP methyl ester carboxylesterase